MVNHSVFDIEALTAEFGALSFSQLLLSAMSAYNNAAGKHAACIGASALLRHECQAAVHSCTV